MARYKHPAMKQLADQQVRYTPVDMKREQIERAEEFLSRIQPDQSFGYGEISERLTGYRSDRFPSLEIVGSEAAHDVRCFIEDLSGSLGLTQESVGEPILTVEEISRKYNVSTKTVDRWRNRGLAGRRFKLGNRQRVGFLESSVERFVARNSIDVDRGSRFSQLTNGEREQIIRRARRLARAGGSLSEISRRLAARFGRSQETIRYTLRNHDEQYPESAIFPDANGPLTADQKRDILQSFRRGVTVSRIARKYGRTRSSIYRIVSEQRAARMSGLEIDYMHSDDFEAVDADEAILHSEPPENSRATVVKAPPGLPPYLASLYLTPLLNREQEAYYFRKMNYLKFKAARLREQIDPKRPSARQIDAIDELLDESQRVKNFLIRSNLRLVVSIAKKHIRPQGNFFEMVSDGNMSLIRAIEKFDYSRGNKFSTYATWAIMKNFARSIPAEHVQLDRFRTGNDEVFQASTDSKPNPIQLERENRVQKRLITRILDHLDEREKQIIISRFGLEPNSDPQTLEQVGIQFGVTKERIRQLESRALRKLRKVADQQRLDIPGL